MNPIPLAKTLDTSTTLSNNRNLGNHSNEIAPPLNAGEDVKGNDRNLGNEKLFLPQALTVIIVIMVISVMNERRKLFRSLSTSSSPIIVISVMKVIFQSPGRAHTPQKKRPESKK